MICLRCLEKSPDDRYASASALAEDLRRFLRDEPIEARPPSWWERGARWRRRNPGLVRLGLGVAACALLGGALAIQRVRAAGFQAQAALADAAAEEYRASTVPEDASPSERADRASGVSSRAALAAPGPVSGLA